MPATIVQPGGSRTTFGNVSSDPGDVPTSPDNRIDPWQLALTAALGPLLQGLGAAIPGPLGQALSPALAGLGQIPFQILNYEANADAAAESNRRRDLALGEFNRFDPKLNLSKEYDPKNLMVPYANQASRMVRSMDRTTRGRVNEEQARLGASGVGANQVAKAVGEIERKGTMDRSEAVTGFAERSIQQKNNYLLNFGDKKMQVQRDQITYDASRLAGIASILMADYNIPGADAIGATVNGASVNAANLAATYEGYRSAERVASTQASAATSGAWIGGGSNIVGSGLLGLGTALS